MSSLKHILSLWLRVFYVENKTTRYVTPYNFDRSRPTKSSEHNFQSKIYLRRSKYFKESLHESHDGIRNLESCSDISLFSLLFAKIY